MRFSIFGIPTEVQFSFWFGALMLGLPYLQADFKPMILIWVAVVFLSVLAHEFGHALAIRAFGMEPEISLQWLGGLTSWSGGSNLSRMKRIIISFAGPLAGFLVAGTVYAATRIRPELLAPNDSAAELGRFYALRFLMTVNFFWGIVNLAPVLPLDGGHILEHALGPKRARMTAAVSMTFGASVAVWAFYAGSQWMGFLFAMCALQSFQRWQAEKTTSTSTTRRPDPRPVEPPMSPAIERDLKRASDALDANCFLEARTLADTVLAQEPPRTGRIRALEIVAWSHLLEGSIEQATQAVRAIEKHGRSDAALAGGLLQARGDLGAARAVFEAARSIGDDRKEVVGPLIQILIAQGEVARAAALALDIVDSLSHDDVRQMATIALDQNALGWAARLHEAAFERSRDTEDAFAAARARALEGDAKASLTLLEKAVKAGFSDMARVRADGAFAQLCAAHGDAVAALLPKD